MPLNFRSLQVNNDNIIGSFTHGVTLTVKLNEEHHKTREELYEEETITLNNTSGDKFDYDVEVLKERFKGLANEKGSCQDIKNMIGDKFVEYHLDYMFDKFKIWKEKGLYYCDDGINNVDDYLNVDKKEDFVEKFKTKYKITSGDNTNDDKENLDKIYNKLNIIEKSLEGKKPNALKYPATISLPPDESINENAYNLVRSLDTFTNANDIVKNYFDNNQFFKEILSFPELDFSDVPLNIEFCYGNNHKPIKYPNPENKYDFSQVNRTEFFKKVLEIKCGCSLDDTNFGWSILTYNKNTTSAKSKDTSNKDADTKSQIPEGIMFPELKRYEKYIDSSLHNYTLYPSTDNLIVRYDSDHKTWTEKFVRRDDEIIDKHLRKDPVLWSLNTIMDKNHRHVTKGEIIYSFYADISIANGVKLFPYFIKDPTKIPAGDKMFNKSGTGPLESRKFPINSCYNKNPKDHDSKPVNEHKGYFNNSFNNETTYLIFYVTIEYDDNTKIWKTNLHNSRDINFVNIQMMTL